jgi:hypothetical protein
MRLKGGGDSHKLYLDAEVVSLVQRLFKVMRSLKGYKLFQG